MRVFLALALLAGARGDGCSCGREEEGYEWTTGCKSLVIQPVYGGYYTDPDFVTEEALDHIWDYFDEVLQSISGGAICFPKEERTINASIDIQPGQGTYASFSQILSSAREHYIADDYDFDVVFVPFTDPAHGAFPRDGQSNHRQKGSIFRFNPNSYQHLRDKVVIHEMFHALGTGHAWMGHAEYGDYLDFMGGGNVRSHHYPRPAIADMFGWLSPSSQLSVIPLQLEVPMTATLSAYDDAQRSPEDTFALKFQTLNSGRVCDTELPTCPGLDIWALPEGETFLYIAHRNHIDNLAPGIEISVAKLDLGLHDVGGTVALDMVPSTETWEDSSLKAGQTYIYDTKHTGLVLNVDSIAEDGNSADVRVSWITPAEIQGAVCADGALPSTSCDSERSTIVLEGQQLVELAVADKQSAVFSMCHRGDEVTAYFYDEIPPAAVFDNSDPLVAASDVVHSYDCEDTSPPDALAVIIQPKVGVTCSDDIHHLSGAYQHHDTDDYWVRDNEEHPAFLMVSDGRWYIGYRSGEAPAEGLEEYVYAARVDGEQVPLASDTAWYEVDKEGAQAEVCVTITTPDSRAMTQLIGPPNGASWMLLVSEGASEVDVEFSKCHTVACARSHYFEDGECFACPSGETSQGGVKGSHACYHEAASVQVTLSQELQGPSQDCHVEGLYNPVEGEHAIYGGKPVYTNGCMFLRYYAHRGQWRLETQEQSSQALVIRSDAPVPHAMPPNQEACTLEGMAVPGSVQLQSLCIDVTFEQVLPEGFVTETDDGEIVPYCYTAANTLPSPPTDVFAPGGYALRTHYLFLLGCLLAALLLWNVSKRDRSATEREWVG